MGYNVEAKIDKNARIAVLAGGMSNEREVSLRSGKNCHNALLRLGYKNAALVDVTSEVASKLKEFDFVYNALHGKFGEDGCIQGLLEIMKIPYTGCGVKASAICMDKETTKEILRAHSIPVIKSVFSTDIALLEQKSSELTFPLMVKPCSEGSSIGMTKVNTPSELQEALKTAEKSDKKVMIEEYKDGISCTVGVLQDGEKIFATPILEFKPKNEWYDYEAKYTKGMTEFILPEQFDGALTKKIREIALNAHRACECSGVSRVDFLVWQNEPFVLEINTSPGMTDTSDLPAQAQEMGISYDNLVQIILNSAIIKK